MPFRTDRMLEIETKLAALASENAALRRRISLSMRVDHICPSCEHEEVMHLSSVLDRSADGRSTMALIQPSLWSSKIEGELEVYFCGSCGFVEWYVKDPSIVGTHAKSESRLRTLRPDMDDR